jgi:glycosyltransferase involved in cell wall biosynthesis
MSEVMISDARMKPADSSKRSVAYVARYIPHYRVEFLNGLEERLKGSSIGLTVFSDHAPSKTFLADGVDQINSAVSVPNYHFGLRHILSQRFIKSGGKSMRPPYWQPIFRRLLSYDLVIVEQSNSALLNYPLIARRRLLGGSPRVAFYGHGVHLQRDEEGPFDWVKKTQARHVDHWFAYTQLSADIIREFKINDDIVTTVNNSIDTTHVRMAGMMDAVAKAQIKQQLGLGDSRVVVFCARLSINKALPFVVEACRIARTKFPNFSLLVIGDGYHGPWLREQAANESWIRPLGALYGPEKAEILAISDVFLLPSMVGLSILDGLAAGLPVITARFGNHCPEIAYLHDGINGVMTDATPEAYADAIVRLLRDEEQRKAMSVAARQTAEQYSVEAMIENFAGGIERVLAVK